MWSVPCVVEVPESLVAMGCAEPFDKNGLIYWLATAGIFLTLSLLLSMPTSHYVLLYVTDVARSSAGPCLPSLLLEPHIYAFTAAAFVAVEDRS